MNTPPVISRLELENPQALIQLDLACREWGLFYITDHGVGRAETLFEQTRAFFLEPRCRKLEVRRTRDNPWGYFDEELTKNTRDWKEIFDVGPERDGLVPQWPAWQPGLRQATEVHYAACKGLSFEILRAISRNLGVGGDFLFHAFEPEHSSFLRLNYYPSCPDAAAPEGPEVPDQGYLGVNHHTDSGALTLLMTDGNPGLEVYLHDRWHPVASKDDALIVNLGDVIQVWSNDRYRAPLHRVRCRTSASRISIPFFFNPSESFDYAPLTPDRSGFTGSEPPRYRSINFGEFRSLRVAGDFADNGEEVQIDQYRINRREE